MSLLTKPTLYFCDASHAPLIMGQVTPLTLKINGWGYLSIAAPEQSDWPVQRRALSPGKHELNILAPTGATLIIRCINLFGGEKTFFTVPSQNPELRPLKVPVFAMPSRTLKFRLHTRLSTRLKRGHVQFSVRLPKHKVKLPKVSILLSTIRPPLPAAKI